MGLRTVGVEEEFLLVDPTSGRPTAQGSAVLEHGATVDVELTGELQREQLETATAPCTDLRDLAAEIRRARAAARAAARATGVDVAPLATSPLPAEPTVSTNERYERIVDRFGRLGDEQLTCGCHVHVAVDSEDEAVAALDGLRPWLAPLVALAANSPFWAGADSGYASYRYQVWGRWPSSGPTGRFGSPAAYRAVTETMLGTDTLLDHGMLYFDARVSAHQATAELRVADVCREPEDAVLVAALARGLVETAVREWRDGVEPDPVRTEVLRLAAWRASRSGLTGALVDPATWRPAPAAEVMRRLVEHVTPALDDAGDLATVRDLAGAVLRRGTGAERQREVLARTGDLREVVRDALHP